MIQPQTSLLPPFPRQSSKNDEIWSPRQSSKTKVTCSVASLSEAVLKK
jgi:hypothetical protein